MEEKLRVSLRPDVLRQTERELGTIAIAPPRVPTDPGLFTRLRAAVADGDWLAVNYQSLRRVAEHRLLPRRLEQRDGRWYCTAVSLESGEERTYRVDRMQEIIVIPPPKEAAAALAAAAKPDRDYRDPRHPEIVLRLTYRGRRVIEDLMPEVGPAVASGDGCWMLRFRCPPAELDYCARLLHGLGTTAEALAPPELRDRIFRLAQATTNQYADVAKGDTQLSPSPS